MSNGIPSTPKLRIVVGCDVREFFIFRSPRKLMEFQDAGLLYKDTIKADLKKDPRVSEVIDVGINGDEKTLYAHVAVSAAKKVASGEADRALLICGTGLGTFLLSLSMSCR